MKRSLFLPVIFVSIILLAAQKSYACEGWSDEEEFVSADEGDPGLDAASQAKKSRQRRCSSVDDVEIGDAVCFVDETIEVLKGGTTSLYLEPSSVRVLINRGKSTHYYLTFGDLHRIADLWTKAAQEETIKGIQFTTLGVFALAHTRGEFTVSYLKKSPPMIIEHMSDEDKKAGDGQRGEELLGKHLRRHLSFKGRSVTPPPQLRVARKKVISGQLVCIVEEE